MNWLFWRRPRDRERWFEEGYAAGIRKAERDPKTTAHEIAKLKHQIISYKNTIKDLNLALAKAKGGKPKKSAPVPFIKTNAKRYIPPLDNQKIVKDSRFCVYCGEKATTADHMTPKSRGGHDGYANLVPACYHCNQEKGNMTYDEYVKWLKYHYAE